MNTRLIIDFKGEELSLNLIDEGHGDAVLILHGWGTSLNVYQGIINSLIPHKRVVSYDIPGFGESSEPAFAYSTDDYAELSLNVLGKLGITKVTLIGHSHGGRTILNIASNLERLSLSNITVEKIILIDSAGIVPKKSFIQKLRIKKYKLGKRILSIKLVKRLFPDALEIYKKRHGSADYKAVSGVMRDSMVKVVNDDYKDRMSCISVPTLLIWGTNDNATPLSDAIFMEKAIPDAGLVKIQGGGHYSFLDNPELTKRVIYSFLNISE